MSRIFRQYDPGMVTVTIGGYTMIGFHSGTFVKCSRNNPTWKHEKGAQGDGVRTRSRDNSGKMVITLQGTSPSNDDLTTLAADDEDPDANPDPVPASVIDHNGTTIWDSKNAWVEKPADFEAADDHTPKEWTIVCDDLNWHNGGSLK